MAMLERDATFAELYENWAAHARRVFRAHSEFSKVITGDARGLTESQELIAEAETVLARSGVMIVA
jgi:hypothetical protein